MASLRWNLSVLASRWKWRARYLVRAPRAYKNWWVLPLPKLGVSVLLKLRNGLSYFIRAGTTDLAVINETSLADPYAVAGFETLGADPVVIDVGANIGDFTMKVARLYPAGRIVAVEPVAEHCRMIEIQKLLNGADNVTVLRAALGAREGTTAIHVAGGHSSAGWGQGPVQNVRELTLASLLEEQNIQTVDLLKMDCEGAEWDIIPAAEGVLGQIDRIVMEFHRANGWTPERLALWLRDRGFDVEHTTGSWNGLLWAKRRDCAQPQNTSVDGSIAR